MSGRGALVSVGLPVRNAGERIDAVVRSVLAQDHSDLELVICDNASTDDTQDRCREWARADTRVRYVRHQQNIGLLNNFVFAISRARGEYFRWIGDDDALMPASLSKGVAAFQQDSRLILVTARIRYLTPDGTQVVDSGYDGAAMADPDPVVRFREMLRLLNESAALVDPLYGLVRREPVAAISRRNMLREDEVFAAKLALAGPWGHIPQVLGVRHTKVERHVDVARRLGVPVWQARLSTTLQCRELLRVIASSELRPDQRRRARRAVGAMYTRRQRIVLARRSRKLIRMVLPTSSVAVHQPTDPRPQPDRDPAGGP